VLTNQARQDPHAWPGWDTSKASGEPRRALGGLSELFEAARFHAEDMAENRFFAHESSDGTSFSGRISRYFEGPAGENIYTASFEDPYSAMNGWMNSEGHRRNILEHDWTWLGTGHSVTAGQTFYVQDFGATNGARVPPIPAASWNRIEGDRIELEASYYDATRQRPRRVWAAIGADEIDLVHLVGPAGNQTYRAEIASPSACHALVFFADSGDGERTRYPSTGSLLAGKGCTQEFEGDRRPPAEDRPGGEDRPVIDAEDVIGCRCVAPRTRSWIGLLLAAGVLFLRRRR